MVRGGPFIGMIEGHGAGPRMPTDDGRLQPTEALGVAVEQGDTLRTQQPLVATGDDDVGESGLDRDNAGAMGGIHE